MGLKSVPLELLHHIVTFVNVQELCRLKQVHITSPVLDDVWQQAKHMFKQNNWSRAPRNVTTLFYVHDMVTQSELAYQHRQTLIDTLCKSWKWHEDFRKAYPREALPTRKEVELYGHRVLVQKGCHGLDCTQLLDSSSCRSLIFNASVAHRHYHRRRLKSKKNATSTSVTTR